MKEGAGSGHAGDGGPPGPERLRRRRRPLSAKQPGRLGSQKRVLRLVGPNFRFPARGDKGLFLFRGPEDHLVKLSWPREGQPPAQGHTAHSPSILRPDPNFFSSLVRKAGLERGPVMATWSAFFPKGPAPVLSAFVQSSPCQEDCVPFGLSSFQVPERTRHLLEHRVPLIFFPLSLPPGLQLPLSPLLSVC